MSKTFLIDSDDVMSSKYEAVFLNPTLKKYFDDNIIIYRTMAQNWCQLNRPVIKNDIEERIYLGRKRLKENIKEDIKLDEKLGNLYNNEVREQRLSTDITFDILCESFAIKALYLLAVVS